MGHNYHLDRRELVCRRQAEICAQTSSLEAAVDLIPTVGVEVRGFVDWGGIVGEAVGGKAGG